MFEACAVGTLQEQLEREQCFQVHPDCGNEASLQLLYLDAEASNTRLLWFGWLRSTVYPHEQFF